MDKVYIKLLLFIIFIIMCVSVIPALLTASNDIAVIIGVLCVVSLIYGVIKYNKVILEMIGLNPKSDREEK